MKNRTLLFTVLAALILWLGITLLAKAQSTPPSAHRHEYAIIKWDGPDKLQFITPTKCESLRALKSGAVLPPDIHDEEYCVMWAVNRMAKDGWEVVTLHATRVMLRRDLP